MGHPIIIITTASFVASLWVFDTRDFQMSIFKKVRGELDYYDTLYPRPGDLHEFLAAETITYLKTQGEVPYSIRCWDDELNDYEEVYAEDVEA